MDAFKNARLQWLVALARAEATKLRAQKAAIDAQNAAKLAEDLGYQALMEVPTRC